MPKVIVTYHPDTYDEFFAEPLKAFPDANPRPDV